MAAADEGEWRFISPNEAGFNSDLEALLDNAIAEKRIWNLHGVVIVRKGRLVLERYFEGDDNARGRPLGKVAFRPDTLHDLRSVSKSIVGLLYGIALADRKVPPPEAPLLASFPEYTDLAADPARNRWTIHNALTMTMGTDWDELSVPYSDPTNSEIAMDRAPDRYRFVLGAPVVMEPGKRWNYNGGATALLARIIAQGAGKPIHAFARETLFDPLGIDPTEWYTDRSGEAIAASGLRMTPRDLARIGLMMLKGGIL
jgi:CubicO group peptidase (beta-lactamase class C family)